MVSSITLVPLAIDATAIICACMSVGNPGYTCVVTSHASGRGGPEDGPLVRPAHDRGAALLELAQRRLEVVGDHALERDVAAGHRRRGRERGGLGAVGGGCG